jgi:septal ring factor EnvC (AmiA/AmiB activator)
MSTLAAAVAAGFIVVSGVSASPVSADDGPPSGYPTWSDVQQAKGNVAATKAEVAKINGLLDSLSAESDALGTAAVQAGASYAATQAQLDLVNGQVSVLQAQTNRAEKQALGYQKDVAAAAVQSYKSGGANLGIFNTLATLGNANALQGLDMLAQVGGQSAGRAVRAKDAEAVASSLAKSRQAAEAEQAKLTAASKSALAAAIAAQQAVARQLAARKKDSATLTAQLAALNNTTAAVEQKYRQGQDALAAYEAAQAAKRKAAAEEATRQAAAAAAAVAAQQGIQQPAAAPSSGGGFIPVAVLLPNIPGEAVNDPSGAQAYAASRLGAHGWPQSQFQCLLQLWNQESGWLTNATNPSSGAYGIAQALPPGKYADTGSDWLTNYRTQIDWGLGYIGNRYGSPCGAWSHEVSNNWY